LINTLNTVQFITVTRIQ